MSTARKIAAGATWVTAGNIASALSQLAVVLLIARLGTAESVGVFSFGMAVVTPALMLSSLQLRAVQATDSLSAYSFKDFLVLRSLTTGGVTILLAAAGPFLAKTTQQYVVIVLLAIAKLFESYSLLTYGLLQKHGRLPRVGQSMMLRCVLSLVLLAVLMQFSGDVRLAIIGLAAANLLTLVFFDIPACAGKTTEEGRSWEPGKLKPLLLLSLPLGVALGVDALCTAIPRYFVGSVAGMSDLGVFTVLSYLIFAGSLVMNGFGEAVMPSLASSFQKSERARFGRLSAATFGVAAAIGIGGMAASAMVGNRTVELLFGPEYVNRSLMLLLALAGLFTFLCSACDYVILGAKLFSRRLVLVTFSAAVLLAGCIFWVPSHGVQGAAYALIASRAAQLCLALAVIGGKLGAASARLHDPLPDATVLKGSNP